MSNLNNKSRRVSLRQLEILHEFLDGNRDIASAYNRSLQAKDYSFRKWSEVTAILNAVGDGTHKDWRGWSKYWVDLKAKLKKRVAAVRVSQTRTGGGPSSEQPLTEIEIKFLSILGENFGQGLPGVRVEPFLQFSGSASAGIEESTDSPMSESILFSLNAAAVPEDPILPVVPPPNYDTIPPSPTMPRTPSPDPRPHPATPPPAAAAASTAIQSPSRRRQRRQQPLTQEAARRSLLQYAQTQTDASLRSATALEEIVNLLRDLRDSALRRERNASGAFPRADEQGNSA